MSGKLRTSDGRVSAVRPSPASSSVPGSGGSAMPCGFMLPAARVKVAPAFWLPEVRVAAAVYW